MQKDWNEESYCLTKDEDDLKKSFEILLRKDYGDYFEEVLMFYLGVKAKENPNFLTKVNQSIYRGIHKNLLEQRERTSNIETLAVCSLSIPSKSRLKMKKNQGFVKTILSKIDNFRSFNIDDIKETYEDCLNE